MEITVDNQTIVFQTIKLEITNRNQINIFKDNNKRTLISRLDKAINNPKDRLHKIAFEIKNKYNSYHSMKLGEFLLKLKIEFNSDYKLFLNKYGDGKFCKYSINNFKNDKGIYCYILNKHIVYIGRSKKNFEKRFKDYGKITAYNCLIDGQATNCNINSKVNELESLNVGFYLMNNSTDQEIELFEKKIINELKDTNQLWNVQLN